jgi:hypothetical protein
LRDFPDGHFPGTNYVCLKYLLNLSKVLTMKIKKSFSACYLIINFPKKEAPVLVSNSKSNMCFMQVFTFLPELNMAPLSIVS